MPCMRIMISSSMLLSLMAMYHIPRGIGGVFGFTPRSVVTKQRWTRYSSSFSSALAAVMRREEGMNPSTFKGSDLTITEYPHPVLRRYGDDVEKFDDDFRQLTKEMMTIMYQASGVGLAAPQVGLSKRLFVYNPTADPERKDLERIVVNPTILEYSDAVEIEEEACLSSRSGRCAGLVSRSNEIMVDYQSETGGRVRKRLKGFEARIFQHEYDHIEGILHFDRLCPEDRQKIQPILDKLVTEHDPVLNGGAPVLDPDKVRFGKLRPPPLPRRGWMPPLVQQAAINAGKKGVKKKKMKKKTGGAGGGFGGSGGGGFGGGGGGKKKKKK